VWLAVLSLAAAAAMAAWTAPGAFAAETASAAPERAQQALVRVTFLEDFFESDAHAGIWVAKDKGFWEQQGLDVAITPGAGSGITVQQVAAGNYTFGYANGFVMAQQVARGADVIAIASPAPKFGGGVVYWPDRGITTPKDLEGKTYLGVASGFVDQLLPLFARNANFDVGKVNVRSVEASAGSALFAARQGDAVSGDRVQTALYSFNGQNPKVFAYADYGINPIGFALIANARQVRAQPGITQRFVTGLLKGWNWACGNPRQAVTIMRTHYNPTIPFETSLERWKTFCGYARVPDNMTQPFGWMPLSSWQTTVKLIRENAQFGGAQNAPPAATLYTNVFVERANVAKPKPKAKPKKKK
jgi:NitT/TauT family transport system substrate-binding protein